MDMYILIAGVLVFYVIARTFGPGGFKGMLCRKRN